MPRNPNKIDYSGGLPESFHSFLVIEDPRTGGNKRHHFGEVLFMVVVGLLCGMDSFVAIEDFCNSKANRKWLKKWIKLPNGVPRAQTFSNIFQLINPDQFKSCLIEHVSQLFPTLRSEIIAVDGKTLRGSGELAKGTVHAVSAWAAGAGVTLAQEFVSEKSNEITAIPKLLKRLDLEGHLVTIDAIGAQTEIAQQIIGQNGDYLFSLKGNQGTTHQEAIDHVDFALRHLDLKTAKGWSHHQETETSHGRKTTRTVLASRHLETFDPEIREKWTGLKSIIAVETKTTMIKAKKERKVERCYYMSSEKQTAEEFGKSIRSHWSIENPCHWVLDVTFREDHSQIRKGNAAKNMGTARRIVLNLLKSDKTAKLSLPRKRFKALTDEDYREQLLSLA